MKIGAVRAALLSTAILGLTLYGAVPSHAQMGPQISATTIPSAQLIQPAALNKLLKGPASARPLVLQVGFHMMYQESHIAGAEYAGPAASPEGLQALRERVKSLPHNKLIVIYCGCCPWGHCPNMGPAYKELRAMGFTRVKALYLPDNFGTDWVNQGYAVTSGQ